MIFYRTPVGSGAVSFFVVIPNPLRSPMRTLLPLLLLLAACSSTSGTDFSFWCLDLNNGPAVSYVTDACLSCEQSACVDTFNGFVANCDSVIQCWSRCDCSDGSCLSGCYGLESPACGPYTALLAEGCGCSSCKE